MPTITPTMPIAQPTTRPRQAPHLPVRLLRLSITTEAEREVSARFSRRSHHFLLTTRPATVKTGHHRPPLMTTAIRPAVAPVIRAPRTPQVTTTTIIQETAGTLSATTALIRFSTRVSTKAQWRRVFTRSRCLISGIFSRHNQSSPVPLTNLQMISVNEFLEHGCFLAG